MTAKQQAIIGAVNALSEALRELCKPEPLPVLEKFLYGDMMESDAPAKKPARSADGQFGSGVPKHGPAWDDMKTSPIADVLKVRDDIFDRAVAPKRVRRPKTAADAPVPVAGYVRRKAGQ